MLLLQLIKCKVANRFIQCAITAVLFTCTINCVQAQAHTVAVIPQPVAIQFTSDSFSIKPSTIIEANDSLLTAAYLLNSYITAACGLQLTIQPIISGANCIRLVVDSTVILNVEGYQLNITKNVIQLTAHDVSGIVHGIATLRQMLLQAYTAVIPGCIINDYPRFAYRGMSLDVSRHLFPISFIKKYIDLLALYKFNTFHWHLTDDQGWRIEIKKYPLLQSKAAYREETLIGHKKDVPHRFDGKKYGGYYTQAEIKEVVAYASQRGITIIPEIEMPGHALAALAAYPNLGCTRGPYQTATFWGIFNDVYCAGNDSTFTFLQDVLDEVMDLFPSKYIHIGGDECLKWRWTQCPKCQRRIHDEHLQNEEALQSYFIQRVEKYVNNKGRSIIGWDEILEGGLAPNATVMSWRGTEGGFAAARQKHKVIMTPESNLYFDYYQSLYKEEPLASGGYLPLKKVYNYEPAADSLPQSITRFIQGVEGQAWSEYYEDTAKAEYMIFPRAIALAEVAWTAGTQKNYTSFLNRLRTQQLILDALHVNNFKHYDEINYTVDTVTKGAVTISMQSSLLQSAIKYTTDGTLPSLHAAVYHSPIKISNNILLQAQLYNEKGEAVNRTFQHAFHISKSTGAKVELNTLPVARFNPGAQSLVNGIYASDLYNDNQWLGFAGDDCNVVIDLGKIISFNTITLRFLNYHWQKMWLPKNLQILVSDDNKNYKAVYTQNDCSGNGIVTVKAQLPQQHKQYIKVIAKNIGMIPRGEYGEGGKALLLLDEVQVN